MGKFFNKRTEKQIRYSVDVDKDFTGGYNFINWITFMPEGKTKAVLAFILTLIGPLVLLSKNGSLNWVVQFWVGVFFCVAGPFVCTLVVRQFKQMKKGISK
jgi:phosphotransferase system  glucose/maltose/N-acetylglucosamine-specific IIC component